MTHTIEQFTDVQTLLRTQCPSEPVYCIYPHVYRETIDEFLKGFPGRVLYSVKANADPNVLKLLIDAGVHHLDSASLPEVELIDAMEAIIPGPRSELAPHAPRIITIMIDPEKIGKLIGPGGKTIRGIQERTGATIDVEEDGRVLIASTDKQAGELAKAEVEALGAEIKVGSIYEGKVVSTKDFGAFIEIAPGTDGMCHISELADGYVKSVEDVVKIGDMVKVKVINVDPNGRIKLSCRAVTADRSHRSSFRRPRNERSLRHHRCDCEKCPDLCRHRRRRRLRRLCR